MWTPKWSVYWFSFALFLRKLYKCRRNKVWGRQWGDSVSKSLIPTPLIHSIQLPYTWRANKWPTNGAAPFGQFSSGCLKRKPSLPSFIPPALRLDEAPNQAPNPLYRRARWENYLAILLCVLNLDIQPL